jgi:hypothetical protein
MAAIHQAASNTIISGTITTLNQNQNMTPE